MQNLNHCMSSQSCPLLSHSSSTLVTLSSGGISKALQCTSSRRRAPLNAPRILPIVAALDLSPEAASQPGSESSEYKAFHKRTWAGTARSARVSRRCAAQALLLSIVSIHSVAVRLDRVGQPLVHPRLHHVPNRPVALLNLLELEGHREDLGLRQDCARALRLRPRLVVDVAV